MALLPFVGPLDISFIILYTVGGSWDGVVGIATGYGLEERGVGVRVPVGSPNLLSNGYRRFFPGGKAAGA
jgi:hypothetical protein